MEKKIIYLDRNENNYGPAPKCFEVIKNAGISKFSYYSRSHETGVKSYLSKRLAADLNVNMEQILLGYGAEDLLKQTVQFFIGQGQKLLAPAYSWWYYKKLASEANGTDVEYPMIVGADRYEYDVDEMIRVYQREKPSLFLISSPNNPTGNSLSSNDLNIILEKTKDTIVILDEAYLSYTDLINAKKLIAQYPNLIIIRTFSKYYALAGLRIGYAIVGENFTNLRELMNRYLGYNRLSEDVAIAALDSADYYQDIYNKMKQDKEIYYRELAKINDFTVYKSDANFILVKVPRDIMPGLKSFLNDKGLIIKFMNEEILNSHLRITIGTQEENALLITAIQEYFNR